MPKRNSWKWGIYRQKTVNELFAKFGSNEAQAIAKRNLEKIRLAEEEYDKKKQT